MTLILSDRTVNV